MEADGGSGGYGKVTVNHIYLVSSYHYLFLSYPVIF